MKASLVKERIIEDKFMRDAYCETLMEIAGQDERLVVLDADLMGSMGTKLFLKAYPERAFDLGIQEANMIGTAAGLSLTGKIPFAHTFAPFASRRAYDQVFLSCGYAKANVRIMGSDPGITAAYNGGTHMPFEDMGIMRNIPNITILEPVDTTMLKDIMKQTMDLYGVFYIRLLRKNAIKIYGADSTFEIGKAVKLKEGEDITIICSGIMVDESLKAAEKLEKEGIKARVLNMFTLKPLDEDSVVKAAKETGAIVTAENHSVINGLGSAVAEVLCENELVPLERIGVFDRYGQVGDVEYLKKEYNMTYKNIMKKAKRAISRKK